MASRRKFIKTIPAFAGISLLAQKMLAGDMEPAVFQKKLMSDDDAELYWDKVRDSFLLDKEVIYLNNAGLSPQPQKVLDFVFEQYKLSNLLPSFNHWRTVFSVRDQAKQHLAVMMGCGADEVVINRNATEGLNTIIHGLPLKAGDEVVISKLDYPAIQYAFKQRQAREGIKVVEVPISFPASANSIIEAYKRVITNNTRLVFVTHVLNLNGFIMPVSQITKLAANVGAEVLVDGAQSLGVLPFTMKDLGCDYFAASLHKWMNGPFGTGVLFVKKEKVKKIWPLISDEHFETDQIKKLEALGSRSMANEAAVLAALGVHKAIGVQNKQSRLIGLNKLLHRLLDGQNRIEIISDKENTTGIFSFCITDKDCMSVYNELKEKRKILISFADDINKKRWLRISPGIFTMEHEINTVASAIKEIASR